jgi:hypothetical protein
MSFPINVADLDPWAIYVEDASWPAVSGYRFIVDAAADMAWIKFGITPRDIALDDEHPALRNEIAGAFAKLLMRGSLVASARPVGGGRILPIAEAEWTNDVAVEAVATGLIRRRHRSSRTHPHTVFIGAAEAAMMGRVYEVTAMLYPREDSGTPEELGGIVLGNLSAIAGNKVALAPERSARRVLELLLPSLKLSLDHDDEQKLVAAVAVWLVDQFARDEREGLRQVRADFRDDALEQFSPFMTKRLFEKVWARATATTVEKARPHANRSLPGRRVGTRRTG